MIPPVEYCKSMYAQGMNSLACIPNLKALDHIPIPARGIFVKTLLPKDLQMNRGEIRSRSLLMAAGASL